MPLMTIRLRLAMLAGSILAACLLPAGVGAGEPPVPVSVSGPSNVDPPRIIGGLSRLEQLGLLAEAPETDPPIHIVLRVMVDEVGKVFGVEILDLQPAEVDPAREFASRLWKSAWDWRFRPATRLGVPVKTYLDFTLNPTARDGSGPVETAGSRAQVPPVLETRGMNVVGVTHPVLDATWVLHIPEAVGTGDTLYMSDKPVSVDWTKHDDGSIGYTWPSPAGLVVSVRLKPGPDRLDVRVGLRNDTGGRLEKLISPGGCFQPVCQVSGSSKWSCAASRSISLQQLTGHFIDGSPSRTFIRTDEGLTAVSETRHTQDKRVLYVADTAIYDLPVVSAHEGFWGRSEALLRSAFIATQDAEGTVATGIGFDQAPSVSHSGPPQRCIHSGIYFGDLEPGGSVERRGVVLFGHSAEELFERFAHLGYRTLD